MRIVLAPLLMLLVLRTLAQQADLVLTNGNIITLRADGDRAHAVAIGGGTILATSDNTAMKAYVGPNTKVLSMIMPTRTAIDMYLPFAMHSDYPISRYEPMKRLDGTVNRRARSGIVIGANQRIGVEEAIKAYTVGGAYTTHEQDRKGRIVAGQFADLVVLDKDPAVIDPSGLPGVGVIMTIVGGKIVFGGDGLPVAAGR